MGLNAEVGGGGLGRGLGGGRQKAHEGQKDEGEGRGADDGVWGGGGTFHWGESPYIRSGVAARCSCLSPPQAPSGPLHPQEIRKKLSDGQKPPENQVTALLSKWRGGDDSAFDQLMPAVYDHLRRIASLQMRSERGEHTLQPTALVNEAVLKLVGMEVDWQDRAHFMAIAARQMRRLLVDHARARRRDKRDGGLRVTLNPEVATGGAVDLVDVDDAMNSLRGFDERKAELVELHYFGGLTYREMAEATSVSEATIHRELRLAKAWLRRHLRTPDRRA